MRSLLRPLREYLRGGKHEHCGASVADCLLSTRRGQSSVAVVGAGPAGIYFVDRLRRFVSGSIRIDLFERLPTPFGLVRSGVAPDHPDTKNVVKKFTAVCNSDGVRFLGNVAVGRDVSVPELQQCYNAVVLAHGAEDDRQLGIENENCRGVLSAREFVNWYNGHPMFTDVSFPSLQTVDSVGIIGLGNVALDCARMLLRPVEELQKTDMADHALSELRNSAVKNVHIIGRRGPLQAQFSGKELREILNLTNISVNVHPDNYERTDADMKEPRRAQKVFKEMVKARGKVSTENPPRRLHFHFLEKPSRIVRDSSGAQITSLEVQTQAQSVSKDGKQTQTATGDAKGLPMQLLLKSVGYRGCAIAGVPFDEARGIVPNEVGRVTDADGSVIPGLYVTGWIKRGPQGIIGTNMLDAEQTAQCVSEDLKAHTSSKSGDNAEQILKDRGVEVVTWEGWQQIDAEESRLGEQQGRPRVKITSVQNMLEIARK